MTKFASLPKRILAFCIAALLSFSMPSSCRAESTYFTGLVFHQDGSCATSRLNQSCPSSASCFCVVTVGSVSGLTGPGYAEVDLSEDQSSSVCFEFNASMFAVADKDVQELDFSGAWCGENQSTIKGTYQIVRSAKGLVSVGPLVGNYDPSSNKITLHFLNDK
jgi:hypothetical protein